MDETISTVPDSTGISVSTISITSFVDDDDDEDEDDDDDDDDDNTVVVVVSVAVLGLLSPVAVSGLSTEEFLFKDLRTVTGRATS